jgi:uncharacterized protein
MDTDRNMERLVQEIFETRLTQQYAYHNFAHSRYVMQAAMKIGAASGLDTETDQRLLMAAGLWHDTGFVSAYEGHEAMGCELAAEYLPQFGFSAEEISLVQGMIMATKIPQSPRTLLEQVLADADLCYLGTPDALALASKLFQELNSINHSFDAVQWRERQISFLSGHRFWTNYAIENFGPGKSAYLLSLQLS